MPISSSPNGVRVSYRSSGSQTSSITVGLPPRARLHHLRASCSVRSGEVVTIDSRGVRSPSRDRVGAAKRPSRSMSESGVARPYAVEPTMPASRISVMGGPGGGRSSGWQNHSHETLDPLLIYHSLWNVVPLYRTRGGRMDRVEIERAIGAARVLPVLRTPDAAGAVKAAETLLDAGLDVIELTATTPG